MSVSKNQRAVIVISELTSVPANEDFLYNFVESAGRTTCEANLKPVYGVYEKLFDSNATKARLIQKLQSVGANPAIKAIDLIVMLHGKKNKLGFSGGHVNTATLSTEIRALNLQGKLRLVYSTACFGSSHNDDFIRAGFNTSIGARGVNANGAVETPVLLHTWATGQRIRDALALGETPVTRIPADTAARFYGTLNNIWWKDDVNSDKDLLGNNQLRINSNG